ncbi:hypothetical protein [Endozoicomonas atrinae]|uniref:hypothetical protein n=1 Tax=Endozoicomonas atrinae TaxID=1333660 RepID=UPI003AFFF271
MLRPYSYFRPLPVIPEEPEAAQLQLTDNPVTQSPSQQTVSKADHPPQHEGKPLMNATIRVMPYSEVTPHLTPTVTDREPSRFVSSEVVAVTLMQGKSLSQEIVDREQRRIQASIEKHRARNAGNHSEPNNRFITSPLTEFLSKASPERSLVLDTLLIDSQNVNSTYIIPDGINALEELDRIQYSVLAHSEQEISQTHPSQSTTGFCSRQFRRNTPHREVWATITQKTMELVELARKHPAGDRPEPSERGAARSESALSFPAIIHQMTGTMVNSMADTTITFMIIPTSESRILIVNLIDRLEKYRESLWPPPLSTRQKKINNVYNRLKTHLQKLHAGFYAVHFNKLDQLLSSFSLQKQFNELQENSITEHRCKLVYIKQ